MKNDKRTKWKKPNWPAIRVPSSFQEKVPLWDTVPRLLRLPRSAIMSIPGFNHQHCSFCYCSLSPTSLTLCHCLIITALCRTGCPRVSLPWQLPSLPLRHCWRLVNCLISLGVIRTPTGNNTLAGIDMTERSREKGRKLQCHTVTRLGQTTSTSHTDHRTRHHGVIITLIFRDVHSYKL